MFQFFELNRACCFVLHNTSTDILTYPDGYTESLEDMLMTDEVNRIYTLDEGFFLKDLETQQFHWDEYHYMYTAKHRTQHISFDLDYEHDDLPF